MPMTREFVEKLCMETIEKFLMSRKGVGKRREKDRALSTGVAHGLQLGKRARVDAAGNRVLL